MVAGPPALPRALIALAIVAVGLVTPLPGPMAERASAALAATDLVVAVGTDVYLIPSDGGPTRRVATSMTSRRPQSLAVGADRTVYVGNDEGSFYEFPPDGSPPRLRGLTGPFVVGLAVNGRGDLFSTCAGCSGAAVQRAGSNIVESVQSSDCVGFFPPIRCVIAAGGMAVDRADNVYLSDGDRGRVVVIPGDGGPQRTFDGLTRPSALAVDESRNLIVSDSGTLIRISQSTGARSIVANDIGLNASVSVDAAGTIYVADPVGRRIRRFTERAELEPIDVGVGQPHLVAAVPAPPTIVVQDIDVTRPIGALVLTQMCGAHAEFQTIFSEASGTWLPAIPAGPTSLVGDPVDPAADPRTAAPTLTPGGDADPRQPQYPYPVGPDEVPAPAPATHCGIDLGRARLLTSGPAAGQFFEAHGWINQATIADSRDADTGWIVTGQSGDFVANGGTDRFSGGQLGWWPRMTADTAAFVDSLGIVYDQLAFGGFSRSPNSSGPFSLIAGSTLASAPEGRGLGIAIADARLQLLIPVTADSGRYVSRFTLTAI